MIVGASVTMLNRLVLLLNKRRRIRDIKLTPRQIKYLAHIWNQMWFCDWSKGEHIRVMSRVILKYRGVYRENRHRREHIKKLTDAKV